MKRILALSFFLAFVSSSWCGENSKQKFEEAEFAKLKGKWEIVGAKGDVSAKHIALEFFPKKAGNVVSAFLRVHTKWQEQGQAKQEETTKACRFHRDGNVITFTLTVSPVSAEPGLWVKYKVTADKLELEELPAIFKQARLGLTGTYQRVPEGGK